MTTATNMQSCPLSVTTIECDDTSCSDCLTTFTPGDVALIVPDATEFYCFECITRSYEAMKTAQ